MWNVDHQATFERCQQLPDLSFVHERRVLMVGFTSQWIDYCLSIASVLVARGCEVDLVWTERYDHDNIDLRKHALDIVDRIRPTLSGLDVPGLRVIDYRDLPLSRLSDELVAEVEAQAHEDLIHNTRSVTDAELAKHGVLRNRLRHVGHAFMASLQGLMDERPYDQMLTPNGMCYEWGYAFRLARHRGLPACTFETFFGGLDDVMSITWNEPAIVLGNSTLQRRWEQRAPHEATDRTRSRVRELAARFDRHDLYVSGQFCSSGKAEALRAELALDPDKPTLLVLPSLGSEQHCRVEHFVFRDHVHWLADTMTHLATRDDCNVVLRAHPYPAYNGQADPEDFGSSPEVPERVLERVLPELPAHMRVIGALDPVNTYDLMELGDAVVTYTSTCGLEMALRGRAAVAPTSVHYNDRGFGYAPRSREAYFEALDRLITSPEARVLSERQVELAQCYAEVYAFESAEPFPWNISLPHFLRDPWPVERVLSLEGLLSPYMDSFDLLVRQTPLSDACRTREVQGYIDAILAAGEADGPAALRLMGRLEGVDLARLWPDRPELLGVVLRHWQSLIERRTALWPTVGAAAYAGPVAALADSLPADADPALLVGLNALAAWLSEQLEQEQAWRTWSSALLAEGDARRAAGDIGGALQAYREVAKGSRHSREAWLKLGDVLRASGKGDAAKECFRLAQRYGNGTG